MNSVEYIASSFMSSGVKKILIVDDAFDAPAWDDDLTGEFIDYLQNSLSTRSYSEFDSTVEEIEEVIDYLNSEPDHSDIQVMFDRVYLRYTQDQDPKHDIASTFRIQKETNLKILLPIVELIEKIGEGIKIVRAGLNSAEADFEVEKPDIVFLDYYLDPQVNPGGGSSDIALQSARNASIGLLQKFSNAADERLPSILLMSSENVEGNIQDFRTDANNSMNDRPRISSWRFRFINKNRIKGSKGSYTIEPSAANALLDLSQSYAFGNELDKGIVSWQRSLRSAVQETVKDIEDLDLKDFAYLMRFRLKEENQLLGEYLNWLFCECLVDNITQGLSGSAFSQLGSDQKAVDQIEGSYDGATKKIAELFDKARIERQSRPPGVVRSKRMGDIYLTGPTAIRAVITPDCDLVIRSKGEVGVANPLTVGGTLKPYKSPATDLTNFIIIEHKAYNIKWNKKDIQAIDFSDSSSDEFKYEGTLRSLYAQELQRSVLDDLGRIGVAVAPIIGITARATASIHLTDGTTHLLFDSSDGEANCMIMLPRGGKDNTASVMFDRSFAQKLFASFTTIASDGFSYEDDSESGVTGTPISQLLNTNDYSQLKSLAKQASFINLYKMLCAKKCKIGTVVGFGIYVRENDAKLANAWCSIQIKGIPDDASIESSLFISN